MTPHVASDSGGVDEKHLGPERDDLRGRDQDAGRGRNVDIACDTALGPTGVRSLLQCPHRYAVSAAAASLPGCARVRW